MMAVRQHLGLKVLPSEIRETHRGHRAAQLHAPARRRRQRRLGGGLIVLTFCFVWEHGQNQYAKKRKQTKKSEFRTVSLCLRVITQADYQEKDTYQ